MDSAAESFAACSLANAESLFDKYSFDSPVSCCEKEKVVLKRSRISKNFRI